VFLNCNRDCTQYLQEEEELEPEDLLGGSVCVFFTQSPFSDSAPHPFIIDGRFYYTLEHYFQMQLLYRLVWFYHNNVASVLFGRK
jgi:hypothetical protein